MADTMRPVSFLPGIKCSDCGVEVEISMLADHVCAGDPAAPSAALDPSPPTQEAGLKSMRSFFDRAAELSTNMLKGGRSAPPANIDSKAANSPFLDSKSSYPESPTKSSLNPPGDLLPKTPRSGASRAPLSPRPPKSGNILERMNAIAPGPFDSRERRPSPSPRPFPRKASRDQFPVAPLGASPFDEYERKPSPPPKEPSPPLPKKDDPSRESRSRFHKRSETLSSLRNRSRSRPSTRGSFGDFHRRHASTVGSEKAAPVGLPQGPKVKPAPARPARPQDVDAFLEQLQEEKTPTPVVPRPLTIRKESVSKTPISLPRRPSEKLPQSPPQFSSPPPSNDSVPEWWQSPSTIQAKEIYVPSERLENENARRFPRRTSSKGVNNMRPGYEDPPPMPTGLRRPPALSHAPSDSASSESSGFDGRSRDSTNSTPPTSAGSTPAADFSTRASDRNPFMNRKPSSGKLYEPYRADSSTERPKTANGRRGTGSERSVASTERPGTSGSRPGTSSGRPGTSDSRPRTLSSRGSRPSTSHSRSATVSSRQAPPVLSPYGSDRSEYSSNDRPRTSNGRPGNERPRMPYEFDAPDSPVERFDAPIERPSTSNGPRLANSASRPDLRVEELPPVPRKSPSRQNLQRAARPPPPPPIDTSVNPPPSADHPPESPMDPAIQKGLFTPITLRPSDSSAFPEISTVFQTAEKPPMPPMPVSAPKSPARPRADSAGRRTGRPTKGNCRGCGQAIVGKSVKAADGSLSGRWHKQCFVCMTCRAPFVTTDFYVLRDQPYCARHYHQLNGSLCCGCDTGIEGQYVESERRAKFHPQCFQCGICRVTLRDDYFEFMGVAYCERHAFHVARQANSGPGRGGMLMPGGARRNPERRRTRLMMM
ncbi:hypothetical protein BKA81DRAFT_380493 [Phyllosticta paracitricarpa]